MPKPTILIVDDDRTIARTLKYRLTKGGYHPLTARSGEECLYHLNQSEVDLVLLDMRLPGENGLKVLEQIRRLDPNVPVMMVTAYGSIESAVEAMKAGAYDYISKPINFDSLIMKIEKALESNRYKREVERLRAEQKGKYSFQRIIGKSPAIREVLSIAERIAASEATTVLIQGESGTGKDLLARAIHYESSRRDKPFMEITCTALPATLLESELFGHEKGAFTDAKTRKQGLLELADGGTVFLNEIGHMDPSLQVKLLSVIEHKVFRRVGGKEEITIDVRIIAATNRDLKAAVREGYFREDLYYRLNVLSIHLPLLRDRGEDVILLAHYFLNEFQKEFGKKIEGFAPATEECLRRYSWPGNVRELRNMVERAIILSTEPIITPDLLPPEIRGAETSAPLYRLPEEGISIEEVERQLIKQALDRTGWNQVQAAKLLGLGRGALQYRMKKYGFLK